MKRKVTFIAIFILLFATYSPFIPTVRAAITMAPSTVDESTPLTVSPALEGETTWYYYGMIDIRSNTGTLIGNAYQYRSQNGQIRTMVNPGSKEQWIHAFGGNPDYALSLGNEYTFQPPSPKDSLNRIKISEIIEASGASYVNKGSYIEVTPTSRPVINDFKAQQAPTGPNGCYLLNDTLKIFRR